MNWLPFWLRPVPPPPVQRSKESAVVDSTFTSTSTSLQPISLDLHGDTEKEEEDAAAAAGPMQSIPITGFALGFCTGLYQAGKRSSLVFMAENAHRRPDTVQGWYFYNKTKVGASFIYDNQQCRCADLLLFLAEL